MQRSLVYQFTLTLLVLARLEIMPELTPKDATR